MIKRILFLFFFLPGTLFAQNVQDLLKEAVALEEARQEQEALKKYQELLRIQPTNLVALCKCSELCSFIGNVRRSNKDNRIEYFRAARKYAEVALRVNPRYPDANLVMALAMGRTALVAGGREKIEAVNDIKKYAELTLKYDPENYKAYHILARWYYEVASLSGFERNAARLLYGGLPKASFDQSIMYYEKSLALAPGFMLNYLELAKAYHKHGQSGKARDLLQKLMATAPKPEDDPAIRKEAAELIRRIQSS